MTEPSSPEAADSEPYALLDAASEADARVALLRCCGSRRWVEGMLGRRPFGSAMALASAARDVWRALGRDDQLEAFAAHPAIGEDLAASDVRFSGTLTWSNAEQAGVKAADQATLRALAAGNRSYRERFGHTFIVCASGKSAGEMLETLVARLANDAEKELTVAAGEQEKIMLLRLEKLAAAPSSR